MFFLVIASVVLLSIWYIVTQTQVSKKLAPGDSVYLDHGRSTKVLVSRLHNIRAKPDNIEVDTLPGYTLIEFKDRETPRVYPSDRAQIIASVIAARESGYDIKRAMLEVRGGQRVEIFLGDDTDGLVDMIREPLAAARLVAQGQVPKALPSKNKCRSCGFRNQCQYKA